MARKTIGNGRVTLALIDQKLDSLLEKQEDHRRLFDKHCADDVAFQKEVWISLTGKEDSPGLATRVDRMEQNNIRQDKVRWAIIPLVIASILAQIAAWLTGKH